MVISIAQDHDGAIWVGTFPHGLTRYDPRTQRFETYKHDPADPRSLSNNQVHRVYVDRKGTVWVATDDGLDRFDPAQKDFTVYKLQKDSRLSQSYVGIAEDAAGNLWLGSAYSGLHRFDPGSGQITVYPSKPGDLNGLRDNTVPTVYMSRAGMLWIGTQNGLNSLDPQTGVMRAYDTRNGMPANTVSCLLEDEQGDIWFSTTKGLSKLTPAPEPSPTIRCWMACVATTSRAGPPARRAARGELFFAGFAGAVAFVPTALQEAALDGAAGADEFRDRWRDSAHRSGTTARACGRLLRTRHPRAPATQLLGHVCRPALRRSGGDAIPLPPRRPGQRVARVSEQHPTGHIHASSRGPLYAARANGSGPR